MESAFSLEVVVSSDARTKRQCRAGTLGRPMLTVQLSHLRGKASSKDTLLDVNGSSECGPSAHYEVQDATAREVADGLQDG